MLYREAVVWKRMAHLNIVPFYGVTLGPLQLVSDCMLSGDLPRFIREHPNVNRLGLVSVPSRRMGFLSPHPFTSLTMSPRVWTTSTPATWFTGV